MDKKIITCIFLITILLILSIVYYVYVSLSNKNEFSLIYVKEYGEYIALIKIGFNKIYVVPDTGSHELLLHNNTYIECNEVCKKKQVTKWGHIRQLVYQQTKHTK